MKDYMKLPVAAKAAEGKVRIDYTDPVTGRVLERIEGKNHVFADSLLVTDVLGYVASIPLAVTDYRSTLRTEFPFAPGNLLGYGVPGQGSSGEIQGSFRASDSILRKLTKESLYNKFVYDFTPNQLAGDIGTVSLTKQFYGGTNYENAWKSGLLSEITEVCSYISKNSANIYFPEEYKLYCFSSRGFVGVYDGKQKGKYESLDFNTLLREREDYSNEYKGKLGADFATGKFWYIDDWRSKVNNAYQRYFDVYELNHEFKDVVSFRRIAVPESKSSPKLASTITSTFLVKGESVISEGEDGIYAAALLNQTEIKNWGDLFHKTGDIPQSAEGFDYGHLVEGVLSNDNGGALWSRGSYFNQRNVGHDFLLPLDTMVPYASMNCFYEYYKGTAFFPAPLNERRLYAGCSSSSAAEYSRQALTCYLLPEDTPIRPKGSGVTITYELDVYF